MLGVSRVVLELLTISLVEGEVNMNLFLLDRELAVICLSILIDFDFLFNSKSIRVPRSLLRQVANYIGFS